jgi:FAD/FMN-containing dehydrogenase
MDHIYPRNSFEPKGCNITIDGTAVTAGPGTRAIYLSDALDALNQTFPTGGRLTIGLGGYVTSAGHSILSPRMGLAADLILEMEMVSPDGDILTLNECQNTDLFWAARGVGNRVDTSRGVTLIHYLGWWINFRDYYVHDA